jgi:predicted nucleic acid-binding protein
MSAPRIVLDTQILLDLWVFDDPVARPLLAALAGGAVTALRSQPTDDELARVLARPRFALASARQRAVFGAWQALARPVERLFAAPLGCSDPHDQKFVDLAFSARAHALVSRDKALLRLARRAAPAGLWIGTAPAFIARRASTVAAA